MGAGAREDIRGWRMCPREKGSSKYSLGRATGGDMLTDGPQRLCSTVGLL